MNDHNYISRPKLQKVFVGLLIFILALSACSQAAIGSESSEEHLMVVEKPSLAEPERDMTFNSMVTASDQNIEQIVIKNADLSLVVNDPEEARDAIARMAEEMGGFVVTAHIYQNTLDNGQEVTQADITIRVPAERLDEALEKIHNLSEKPPLSESLNSQDVTREYTDLRSQLRNEEAAEAQLTKLMEQAKTTEEVLKVYEQLIQVRQRIEILKGQIQYYEQSAALSAIHTQLLTDEAVKPLTIGSWQPAGVAKKAVQALINTLKFIVNFIIYLGIYILPVLLVFFVIIGLPVWLIIRAVRRRSRARSSAPPTAGPPIDSDK